MTARGKKKVVAEREAHKWDSATRSQESYTSLLEMFGGEETQVDSRLFELAVKRRFCTGQVLLDSKGYRIFLLQFLLLFLQWVVLAALWNLLVGGLEVTR